MKNRWSRIGTVMQKEFLHVFRDKIVFMIAFLAPIVLGALVGFLYIEQKVTNLPVAVYDQDQSELSRTIIRAFSDSERFKITNICDNYHQVEHLMQSEKVFSVIVIPPHLQQDIKSGKATEVGLIFNGTNILTMNTLANVAAQVIPTISGGITMKIIQGYGVPEQKAYQAVTALSFRSRYWYNPTTSYLVFMLLGLFGTIIQQITFLGVALSFIREKESKSWRHLAFSKLSTFEILMGKLLVYFIIYCIDAIVLYGAAFIYFGVPMNGNPLLFLITVLLFIFVLLAVGMAISILTKSAAQAIEISMLVAVPSFLISGWTWPFISMPVPIQILSKILPLTHFLDAIRRIAYIGAGLDIVWPQLVILGVFGIVFIPLTAFILNRQMLKHNI
jgi:ABC-2 type transport system permease protein